MDRPRPTSDYLQASTDPLMIWTGDNCQSCGSYVKRTRIEEGRCWECRYDVRRCIRCSKARDLNRAGECDQCERELAGVFRHGLTLRQAEALLVEQGGRCAICPRPILLKTPSRANAACVDHDHACCPGAQSCGQCVRGLLCGACNTAIGLLRDDVAIVLSAATYLGQKGDT